MKNSFIRSVLFLIDKHGEEKTKEILLKQGYSSKKIRTCLSDIRRKETYTRKKENCTGKKEVKVVIFDIETTPLKGWVWSKWNNNLYGEQIIQEWFILSWSAKYLDSDVVESNVLTPEEVFNEDDGRIIRNIHKYLDGCQAVIAHNAKKFDCKRLNTRFIYHNLPPLDYRIIDTLDVARKYFSFTSNRLDDLAKFFGYSGKNKTEFSLWSRCMQGDPKALEEMRVYNIQDVIVLENIYKKLRPYIKNHPNIGNMDNETGCPACGSQNIKEEGTYYTNTSTYPKYRCNECGSLSRKRQNVNSKDKMKNLLVSI